MSTKIYHLCLSSHDEVLFRSEEDFNYAFNCLALAALRTESRLLADSIMSDHIHFCSATKVPKEMMKCYRYSYTRRFNAKYMRRGRLGEDNAFILDMNGTRHITAGISYVLRQGLHHGLCSTAFEYQHSSVNCMFQKALGKSDAHGMMPENNRYLYLPEDLPIPVRYRMSESGLLYREDVIDTSFVESLFVTPRSFLYNMSRPSDIIWEEEQEKDSSQSKPITLSLIEAGVNADIQELKRNEFGKNNYSNLTDIELCRIIDNDIVPKYNARSIYELPLRKRKEIAEQLFTKYSKNAKNNSGKFATETQISRCLALKHI